MSLIEVAQRVRGQRTRPRTLLTMIAVTAGIIVGLLGMHSLNSHTDASGHRDLVAVGTSAAAASAAHDVSDAHGAIAGAAADTIECLDCGDDHAMAWMACVLALLAAVVLVIRPRLRWHASALGHDSRTLQILRPSHAQALSPPPSLTVLCISRT